MRHHFSRTDSVVKKVSTWDDPNQSQQEDLLTPNIDFFREYHFDGSNNKYVELDNEDNDRHFGEGRNANGIIDSYKVFSYGGDDTILFTWGKKNFADLGDGKDSVKGADGDDCFRGGNDNDTLKGYDGNDWLQGDDGNDLISGFANRDTIVGGDGGDRMWGGSDADTFIVNSDTQSGADYVYDFVSLGDKIIIPDYQGHQLTANKKHIEIFNKSGGIKATVTCSTLGTDIAFRMEGSDGILEIVDTHTGVPNTLV